MLFKVIKEEKENPSEILLNFNSTEWVLKTTGLQDAMYVAHPISFHATAGWATLLLVGKEQMHGPLGCEKEAK